MPVLMHVLSPLQILDDIYSLFFFKNLFLSTLSSMLFGELLSLVALTDFFLGC